MGDMFRLYHLAILRPHTDTYEKNHLKQSSAIPLLSLRAFVACEKGETYLNLKQTIARTANNTFIPAGLYFALKCFFFSYATCVAYCDTHLYGPLMTS
jgi:hypothetical protein